MNIVKVIVDKERGMVQVFDDREMPTTQDEHKARTEEIDAIIQEINDDDTISQKIVEIE